jgi:hypothetical protein
MKGVFNQRPALPRYQHIWDVNIVLEYLASLSPVNVLSRLVDSLHDKIMSTAFPGMLNFRSEFLITDTQPSLID